MADMNEFSDSIVPLESVSSSPINILKILHFVALVKNLYVPNVIFLKAPEFSG